MLGRMPKFKVEQFLMPNTIYFFSEATRIKKYECSSSTPRKGPPTLGFIPLTHAPKLYLNGDC